jgi:hypothetical protein
MSDPKHLVPHQGARLPSVRAPALPDLPHSSGQLALTPRSRAVKDARYVRAHADWLVARTEQANAARQLSDSRFALAVALSKWQSLGEVCDHEYKKGFLSRASELRVLELELETKEITARIARDQAMLVLQTYQPQPPPPPPAPVVAQPPPPPPPPPPPGLTPGEVDELLAQLNELSPETKKTISYLLHARMREKG